MKKLFTIFAVVMLFSSDLLAQTGDIFPLIPGRKITYSGFLRDKTTDSNLTVPITKSYTVVDSGTMFAINPLVRGLRYAKPTHFMVDSLKFMVSATKETVIVSLLPLKRASNISGNVYLLQDFTSKFAAIGHTSAFPYIWLTFWKEGTTAPTTWTALDSSFASTLGSVRIAVLATLSGPETFTSTVGGSHQSYKVEFKATAPIPASRNTYTIWAIPKFGINKVIVHGDGTTNGQYASATGTITYVPVLKDIVASNYELSQNYPNPFNPTTNIKFSLPEKSNTVIKVYDVLGKEIKSIVNNTLESGKYEITFDAKGLSSGLYFYTINAEALNSHNKFTQTRKMILNK